MEKYQGLTELKFHWVMVQMHKITEEPYSKNSPHVLILWEIVVLFMKATVDGFENINAMLKAPRRMS